MKKVIKPNTILYWRDGLMRVVGISEGRTIHMQPLDKSPCGVCGQLPEISVLEHSPLFQENTKPVETLQDPEALMEKKDA